MIAPEKPMDTAEQDLLARMLATHEEIGIQQIQERNHLAQVREHHKLERQRVRAAAKKAQLDYYNTSLQGIELPMGWSGGGAWGHSEGIKPPGKGHHSGTGFESLFSDRLVSVFQDDRRDSVERVMGFGLIRSEDPWSRGTLMNTARRGYIPGQGVVVLEATPTIPAAHQWWWRVNSEYQGSRLPTSFVEDTVWGSAATLREAVDEMRQALDQIEADPERPGWARRSGAVSQP